MTGARVLAPQQGIVARAPLPRAPEQAWQAVGWFGLLLATIGLGDIALGWYPMVIGNPEWEFGTVAASVSGLPLVTMGFVAMVGAGFGQGSRWLLRVVGCVLIVLGLATGAALLLFLLDVPLALGAAPPEALLLVKKAVVKTVMLGVGFSGAYLLGGIVALKYASKKTHRIAGA